MDNALYKVTHYSGLVIYQELNKIDTELDDLEKALDNLDDCGSPITKKLITERISIVKTTMLNKRNTTYLSLRDVEIMFADYKQELQALKQHGVDILDPEVGPFK